MGTTSQRTDDARERGRNATQISNKDAASDFLRLAASGRVRQAYSTYVSRTFKHHNPYFAAGATALMEGMDQNAIQNPGKSLQILRAIAEGDLVAVHSVVHHAPGDRGAALVHIFRFEDGRIAELWDIGQEMPAQSPNSDGMF